MYCCYIYRIEFELSGLNTMLNKIIFSLIIVLTQTSVVSIALAGGQLMGETLNKSSPEVSIRLETVAGIDSGETNKKAEDSARSILAKIFAEDMAKSATVNGKISFIKKEGKDLLFELNGLFLYRETYTAVTHKAIFKLTCDGYKVLTVDGKPLEEQ